MRKSISDWRRNSFPDTVVIWGKNGQTGKYSTQDR